MSLGSTTTDRLFLGIDGGGSKCRTILVSSTNETLGAGVAGPANPFQDDEQAFDSIMEATALALENAGLALRDSGKIVAGMGLAGVNVPHFYDLVASWQHPFERMFLATDMHIACLAAHGGRDGAVIIAGTGSCGYSLVNGQSTMVGAHGFPLGDKGSGAWIGLEGLKAVLLAADGLGPSTALETQICRQLGTNTFDIVEKLAGCNSKRYAEFAPLVFAVADDGDAVALEIVHAGAAYLNAVAEKLLASGAPRLALLGGIGKYMLPRLDPTISARVEPPLQQPEFGAIHLAQQEWTLVTRDSTGPVSS